MTFSQVNARLGELVDEVVAVDREIAVASARRAVLIDRVRAWSRDGVDVLARGRGEDHGSFAEHQMAERSTVAELGCALRVPEGAASALVVESQALVHEHPATMAALSEGAVSYRHAQAVLGATSGLDETATLTLDAVLSERARTSTVAGLKRVARRERERHDTRPLVERHTVAAKERTVELQSCRDGMAWLHQYLPVVQATAIFNRLTDIALAVQGPDEPRTLAQLRADASVDLLLDDDTRTALASSTGSNGTPAAGDAPVTSIARVADKISLRGVRPQVAVTVPVMTLLGHSEEPGDLAGHGPIDADTARHLAAQAPTFLRLLTHPETGTVLSVGREKYVVPADLRSWLQVRDETCRFPGCSRRAARCDVDHITDWAHGGPTDHDNLIHLCRKHHRLKHTTHWTVHTETDRPPDTTPTTTRTTTTTTTSTGTGTGSSTRGTRTNATSTHQSADVVRWTTPTGRTYLDHAATTITTEIAKDRAEGTNAHARRQELRSSSALGHPRGVAYSDEPPF